MYVLKVLGRRPFYKGGDLLRVHAYSIDANDKSKEVNCYEHAPQARSNEQKDAVTPNRGDGPASAHHVTDQATQRMVDPTN